MKTLNLGAILSLSGEASQDAQGIRDGIELAVEELQKNGTVVQVHYVDDKSDIISSVRAIDGLVREHDIKAIIGPTWANQVDSFAPILDQEHIITFAPAVASDSVIKNSEYLLYGAEKNIYKELSLKKFFRKNKIKKVGIILSQDKWGISHLLPIKNAAQQEKVEIVFIEQLIPYISSFGKKYFRDVIDQALTTQPEALIWSGYEGEADVLIDYILEKGLSIPLVGDQLLNTSHRAAKLKNYKGDLYIFTHKFSIPFIKLFKARYKRNPSLYSDIAFDATILLSIIFLKYSDKTPSELINLIKSKKYQFEGISGQFIFDKLGDRQSIDSWTIDKINL